MTVVGDKSQSDTPNNSGTTVSAPNNPMSHLQMLMAGKFK